MNKGIITQITGAVVDGQTKNRLAAVQVNSSKVRVRSGLSSATIIANIENAVNTRFFSGGGEGNCTPRVLDDNPDPALATPTKSIISNIKRELIYV